MKKKFGLQLSLILLTMATAAVAASAQTISGSMEKKTVARGSSAKGSIVIDIPRGLHVNSNRPESEYAIPTTVRLTAPGARTADIRYPRGKNRKFEFSERLINVYEGRVKIPFTLIVPQNFRGSQVRIRAVVRYQACTDEVCFPPRNRTVNIVAQVR
jgi:DsbC/DsbD-like thiol-disulfide interchange protein